MEVSIDTLDAMTVQIAALRARVAELEASSAGLRVDLDRTQSAVAEEVTARVAAEHRVQELERQLSEAHDESDRMRSKVVRLDLLEQRAATLEAEVERLTQALAESERKRSELLNAHQEGMARLKVERERTEVACARFEKDLEEELARRTQAEKALAEDGRRRAEAMVFVQWVADKDCDHQPANTDRPSDCHINRPWAKPCLPCRAYRFVREGQ